MAAVGARVFLHSAVVHRFGLVWVLRAEELRAALLVAAVLALVIAIAAILERDRTAALAREGPAAPLVAAVLALVCSVALGVLVHPLAALAREGRAILLVVAVLAVVLAVALVGGRDRLGARGRALG